MKQLNVYSACLCCQNFTAKHILSKDYQWACNKLFYGLSFSSNLNCLFLVFLHFTIEQEVEKSENSESDSDDHGTPSA